jgi:hypothetical protein
MNAFTQKIDVVGDFVVDGEISILNAYKLPTEDGLSGQILSADGTGEVVWKDLLPSLWAPTGNNIYRQNGNVGIGLNNPQATLHILEQSNIPEIRLEGTADRFLKFFENGVEEGLVGMNAQDLFLLNRKLSGKVRIGAHGQSTLVIDPLGNVGIGEDNPIAPLHIKDDFSINTILEAPGNKQIQFTNSNGLQAQIKGNDFALEFQTAGRFEFRKDNFPHLVINPNANVMNMDIYSENTNFYFTRQSNISYAAYLGGNMSGFRFRGPTNGTLSLGAAMRDVINISGFQVDILEKMNILNTVEFFGSSNFNQLASFNADLRAYEGISIYENKDLGFFQKENVDDIFGIRFYRNVGPNSYSSNTGIYFDPVTNIVKLGNNLYSKGSQIGIGTDNPDGDLHIKESPGKHALRIEAGDSSGSWSFLLGSGNDFQLRYNYFYRGAFDSANGNYTSVSDERLKENISLIPEGILEKLNRLGIYAYHFKSDLKKKYKTFGFLAQEVTELFPNISKLSEEEQIYTLDYTQMSVLGIKAIQELNQKVVEQASRIQSLEDRLEKLETLLDKK